MKFVHLSDLHIGKKVHEFSMISDQIYIFDQILSIIKSEDIGAVLMSGDIYDKSIPPIEAIGVLDSFLTEITSMNIPVMIISGNHDSPERLGFAGNIMKSKGVHIYSVFDGTIHTVSEGGVKFHLLPFIKPVHVRRYYPDVNGYEDAVRTVIRESGIDMHGKNVMLSHQFVTCRGKETLRSDSETVSLGGVDNIDISLFDGFDYIAMGHIHRPQSLRKNVRYCGSPLKYSFSEAPFEKSVTVVDSLDFSVKTIPLKPLHDMRVIKGDMDVLLSKEIADSADRSDYIHMTLTNIDGIVDAMDKVRNIYPNVMQLEFLNRQTMSYGIYETEAMDEKIPEELFAEFYELQNGTALTGEQSRVVRGFMEETE